MVRFIFIAVMLYRMSYRLALRWLFRRLIANGCDTRDSRATWQPDAITPAFIAPRLLSVTILFALYSVVPGVLLRAEQLGQLAQNDRRFLSTKPPRNASDLRQMQQRIRALTPKLLGITVAVRAGVEYGSGVIVSPEGYVLTAAHVVGQPGRVVDIIMSDGKVQQARALGMDPRIDTGLLKIMDEGPWPFVRMSSGGVKPGQWCLATGHAGGYEEGRQAVLRLGRILSAGSDILQSDCPLEGGDSGGPLFDLQGRVIGVHSRVGLEVSINLHVPVKRYRVEWDRLIAGEVLGGERLRPYIGVMRAPRDERARVGHVQEGSPAEQAGIRPGDLVRSFAGSPVADFAELVARVRSRQPGESVKIQVERDGKTLTLNIRIGQTNK